MRGVENHFPVQRIDEIVIRQHVVVNFAVRRKPDFVLTLCEVGADVFYYVPVIVVVKLVAVPPNVKEQRLAGEAVKNVFKSAPSCGSA